MGVIMDVRKDNKPLNKYFNKTTLIMALAVLAAVSLYTSFNIRSKYNVTQTQLAASQYVYNIIVKEKNRLDSLSNVYKKSIALRDADIELKEYELIQQGMEIASLRESLSNTLEEVSNVNVDSSYSYINLRVPSTSPKLYPFDSTQVKAIHYTFLERDGYFNISAGLDSLVTNLKQTSFIKDNQIMELKSLNSVYLQEKFLCESEKGSYRTENAGLKKEARHQKAMKNVSNVGMAGLILIIIAIIL